MRYLIVILFMPLLCVGQRTVAGMKTDFDAMDATLATELTNFQTYRHGGDSYHIWAYGGAYLNAFLATGSYTYLDKALTLWLAFQDGAVLASSLPDTGTFTYSTSDVTGCGNVYNDSFLTWENHAQRQTSQGCTNGGEASLYEWHGTTWVARMLYVMYQNPQIRQASNGAFDGATYETQYQSILSFYQTNVWDKWSTRGINDHMFRNETHIASHPANAGWFLWKITGQQKYKNYVDAFYNDPSIVGATEANGFKAQLRDHVYDSYGTGFIWASTFGQSTGSNDIGHAATGTFKLIANQLKFSDQIDWNESEKQKFLIAARWSANVSRDNTAPYRLDGTGTTTDSGATDWKRNILYGVAMFGMYNAVFQLELEQHEFYNTSSRTGLNYISQLMYNRAYIDGTLFFVDYDSTGTGPSEPGVAGTRDGAKKNATAAY